METLKNLISPGKAKDDETLYRQGHKTGIHTGHISGLTGEGSHLSDSNNTSAEHTSHIPGSYPSDSTVGNTQHTGIGSEKTVGPHTSNLANIVDPSVDSSRSADTAGRSQHIGLDSGNTTSGPHNSDLLNRADPTVGSQNSRVADHSLGNNQHAGLGSERATSTTGPHTSNIANIADPTVNSKDSRDASLENTQTTTPTFGPRDYSSKNRADPTLGSLQSKDRTGEGLTHHSVLGSGTTSVGQTNDSAFDDVPRGPSGGILNSQTTHTGNMTDPHNSSVLNRADPRIDSGPRTTDNNLGRDAALGAGAAGIAEHEHSKHQQAATDNLDESTRNTKGPHKQDWLNKLDPRVNSNPKTSTTGTGESSHTTNPTHQEESKNDHHLGRDAAVLGTAGAVGEGIHHRDNAQDNLGLYDTAHGSHTGTSGPHNTETANRLDPRVNTRGPNTTLEDAHHHSKKHGGGAEQADHHHSKTTEQSGHHLGRDAAIGGGLGGVGYEAEKHKHQKQDSGIAGIAQPENTNTSGPQSSNLANRVDPRVDSSKVTQISNDSGSHSSNLANTADPRAENLNEHHYGRDAALVGGIGGAGYEAEKHHHKTGTQSGLAEDNTTGQYSNQPEKFEDVSHKEHHHGRDAIVAGGVGGAAYETEQHHQHDKDLKKARKEEKKEHKHEVKEEKKEHKGLLSFLHRDKNKHDTHDAHDKHDKHGNLEESNLPTRSQDVSHTKEPHIAATDQSSNLQGVSNTNEHHLGRDTAAVGGAGALDEHANHQHAHGALPLDEIPPGKDLGDKLHGVERNRGVTGASGFPGQEGFGSGPTHGAGHGLTGQHEGRNRLHKDPPPNHPAAQGGVTGGI